MISRSGDRVIGAAPCNGFEQEVWHKNIAVDNAQHLFEEDLAARTGSIPGAGLNKDHRPKQSTESRKKNMSVLTTKDTEDTKELSM